jgi:D-psicose/D-tagatose/L-ribulose 3-epimerase
MTRRWMHALAACALLLAAPLVTRAASLDIQIGLSTSLETLEAAQDLGFDYLEVIASAVAGLSDEDYAKLQARVKALKIPVRAANSFVPGTIKLVGPETDPAKQQEYVRKCLGRLSQIGVRIVVFGSGKAREVPEGFDRDKAFQQLVEFGRMAATEGGKVGITIVLEPLRKQETNIINSVREGLPLVRAVNHPQFQILSDFYHLAEENEDPAILRDAGPMLRHTHIANPAGRVFPAKADEAAYAPFFANLAAIGYKGGLSVEAKTTDLAKDAPVAIALLKELAKQAGGQ